MTNSADLIELYRFTRGPQVWAFTSADQPVEHQNVEYLPSAIRRGNDEQGQEMNRAAMEVRAPRDNPMAAEFVGYAPENVVNLTVFRRVGSTTGIIWQGRVVGVSFENNEAVFECEPVFTSLRRAGLQARFQGQCRHVLYGNGCNVDRSAFAVPVTVSSVSQNIVTSPGFAAHPDQWFRGGVLQTVQGHRRMILAHVGDTVTLTAAIQGLGQGASVTAFPGCDHTIPTCQAKFDNEDNFGGFPYFPTINPFGGSPIF